MNLARLFSYTLRVEYELRRERALRRRDNLRAERKEQKLIDAYAKAVGKPSVFEKREVQTQSDVPALGIGPSAAQARREKQRREEEEITARAERARNNGNSPDIPVIPR